MNLCQFIYFLTRCFILFYCLGLIHFPKADLVAHQSHCHNYHHHNHYYLNWPYLLVSCSLANWLGEYPCKSFAGQHKRQQTEIKERHLPVERRGKTVTSLCSSVTVMTVSTTVHNYVRGEKNECSSHHASDTQELTHFPGCTYNKRTATHSQPREHTSMELKMVQIIHTLLSLSVLKSQLQDSLRRGMKYCNYTALICVKGKRVE